MSDMKYPIGSLVYFYTMIDKIPGVVDSAEKDENGRWVYKIQIGDTMMACGVREHQMSERKSIETPRYNRGDKVRFKVGDDTAYVGVIEIIDAYGTFEQDEEPSYDIFVQGNPGCLYKHIRQSSVLEVVE